MSSEILLKTGGFSEHLLLILSFMRLPVIGVMGSAAKSWEELSIPLGTWIAEQGFHLLTGGGGGVMESVTKAFASVPGRKGVAIGILPGSVDDNYEYSILPEYPNESVDVAIRTHLPLRGVRGLDSQSRNHINILSSTAIVALPGSWGTQSEVELAVRYHAPIILFGPLEAFLNFPTSLERTDSLNRVQEFVNSAVQEISDKSK